MEKEKFQLDFWLIKKLFRFFIPFKIFFILSIFLLLLAKGIEVYIPLLLGNFVDQILQVPKNPLFFENLVKGSFFALFLILFAYLLETFSVILKSRIGQNALLNLRQDVFSHIQGLPVSFFDRTPVGQLMTRTIHDVDKISQMFTESVVPLISSLFLFIAIFFAILWIDFSIGIILLITFPLTFAFLYFFRKNERKAYREIRGILSNLNAFIQEYLMGSHIVRQFGIIKREKKQFNYLNEKYRDTNIKASKFFSLFFSAIEILHNFFLILLFMAIVLFSSSYSSFDPGKFFTYSLYGLMFFRPLFDLAERYNVLQEALASGERIFSILSLDVEEKEKLPSFEDKKIESIVFEDIWFSYQENEWVLKGISFTLYGQESIALVGVTGAGKTTILNLLLRFYDFQKGKILLNGKNILQFSKESIRKFFAIVLQDPFVFSDTIFHNISLYNPKINHKKVEEMFHHLSLTHFLKKFPLGLDQPVKQGGSLLSAGEKQIVSLLRSFMQERQVLLFDEATANIDHQTEHLIQKTLKKILPTKTSIIIAHRLSTIQSVDNILFLHEGNVVEQGSHQELMKKKGYYEKLYRLQFMKEETE